MTSHRNGGRLASTYHRPPFWSDEYRAIKGRSPGRRRLHWRSLKVSAGVVAIEWGVLIVIET